MMNAREQSDSGGVCSYPVRDYADTEVHAELWNKVPVRQNRLKLFGGRDVVCNFKPQDSRERTRRLRGAYHKLLIELRNGGLIQWHRTQLASSCVSFL
jgi:hypothetical protein